MKTITWTPGTNKTLDDLFEICRSKQFNNVSHRLWKNYSKTSFKDVVALTICFDEAGDVEMCSSICSRPIWPVGSYRILNRLWKNTNKIKYPKIMSPSFAETAKSQLEWLKNNTNFKLYFISRQTNNWEDFGIESFNYYQLEFKKDKYFYLTCSDEDCPTCWQKIIYNGDAQLLNQWKRRI
jgi:hypothetical protein